MEAILMLDPYTIVAEPSRRKILDRLLQSDASVTELANDLGYSQPLVSKHLRILRESGFVHFKVEAQRRIYTLDSRPLAEIDAWLSAYRKTWEHHVDKLSDYLDRKKAEGGREQ
jgi:DNA-binding transcriptional ArsR family regulator